MPQLSNNNTWHIYSMRQHQMRPLDDLTTKQARRHSCLLLLAQTHATWHYTSVFIQIIVEWQMMCAIQLAKVQNGSLFIFSKQIKWERACTTVWLGALSVFSHFEPWNGSGQMVVVAPPLGLWCKLWCYLCLGVQMALVHYMRAASINFRQLKLCAAVLTCGRSM